MLLIYKLCIVIWFVLFEVKNNMVLVIFEGCVIFCNGILSLYVFWELVIIFLVLFLLVYSNFCILVLVEFGEIKL